MTTVKDLKDFIREKNKNADCKVQLGGDKYTLMQKVKKLGFVTPSEKSKVRRAQLKEYKRKSNKIKPTKDKSLQPIWGPKSKQILKNLAETSD